jgi:hypothetical protein
MSFLGGGSDPIAGMAANDEVARQQGVTKATGAINDAYDSQARQQQYTDYGNALKAYYNNDLTRQGAIANRQLKFSLARSGQTGGSTAVDQGRKMSDEYAAGVLNATNSAQGAVAALRGQDESARAQQLALAQGGLSLGDTNGFSGAAMGVGQAKNALGAQSLGDVFGGIGAYVSKQQSEAEQRKAYERALYG